jgi:hypothetical protein
MLAIALVGGLAGCTPSAPSAPTPLPSSSWTGDAPDGPLEADAWVQAARASLEAQAIAQNQNDFSLPSLTDSTGADLRSRLYRDARDTVLAGKRTAVLPGPTPFLPTDVIAESESSASVQGCIATVWSSDDGTAPTTLEPYGIEFRMELEGDHRVITLNTEKGSIDCSDVDLPIALFDPKPKPSSVQDAQDIVGPASSNDGE